MKINFAVICYKMVDDQNANVKHICCYETEPSAADIDSLVSELENDPEFGMVGDHDYDISVISRSVEPEIFETLQIPEEMDNNEPTENNS